MDKVESPTRVICMIRLLTAFALTFLLCSVSIDAYAEETAPAAIGTIAEIEGTVAIAQNSKVSAATVGQDVYQGDIMETGPDSKALVLFIDETELTIGENARMTIDDYIFDDQSPEANKGRFSILRGPFIFATGLLNKNENPDVEIETPYGSIGIRGTTVWGGALDDEYNVFVQEGEITFATARGRVRIGPGQGSRIRGRNAIPERAKAWGHDKIARASKTVALKHRDKVRQRLARFKQHHQKMREHHRKAVRQRLDRQQKKPGKEIEKSLREERQEQRLRHKKDEAPHQNIREKRSEIIPDQVRPKRQQNSDFNNNSPAHQMEQRERRHLQEQKRPMRQRH